jgi:hypothetical protein
MADEYREKAAKATPKETNSMASRSESSVLCSAPNRRN